MSDDESEVSEYDRYSLTESSEPIGLWERALVVDPENGTVQRALRHTEANPGIFGGFSPPKCSFLKNKSGKG